MCCNANMIKEEISLKGKTNMTSRCPVGKNLFRWDEFQLDSGNSVLVAVLCCLGDFLCVSKKWLNTCIVQRC